MVLMVERNRGEHLIRRFAGRGNEPDPRDVKIASLKQRIQELEFPQLQQDSPTEEAETESNVWDDGSEDVNPFGGGNPGFHDDHYDNPLLTKETESEPIIWDIGDEEEEYPFVNKYPKEESMPVYDTDIEDVIEKEEGFVGKRGFGGEEDNFKDIVVVANDLRSSMIPTILSVDFEEDINTKSHELISFGKSIIIKINDNAYKIELPSHYNVSATFNVADLSPYKRDSDDEPDLGSSLFQEGEDDADSVNERVNVANTLGAYFTATNLCG
ncbi:hypothetical protein Tco_0987810 [Tanacetum coccineum]